MVSFATPETPRRLHAAAAACCLHAHLSREPWDGAAGTQIAGALGVSLWQCQATVLWAPEGDVPGDVSRQQGGRRHRGEALTIWHH